MRVAVVLVGGLHPSGRVEVIPTWIGLLSRLAARIEVHAFTLRHLERESTYRLHGIQVHDLGRPSSPFGLTRVAQWRRLRQAVAAHGPFDVIHGVWADPPGLLAALLGRRLGVPSVVTCDSGEFVGLAALGYGRQLTWQGRAGVALTSRLASRVTVATSYMQRLAGARGVSATVIPLGVQVPAAAPRPPDGPPWRLLQVANLNAVKDQRMLVDALALVRKRSDVSLDLAGEGELEGALRAQADALGMTEHVRFHGYVPHDQLHSLWSGAHLYVQSSRHEAACAAVLEAAAADVPILGTACGYVADLAPAGATAVPPGDPAAMADAILSLLDDRARRLRQVESARRFARDYDVAWTADELERLYRELTR